MQKSLHIDPGKCTGCVQCELACSFENEGVFNTAKSRIKVFTFHQEGRFVPYTCTQCDEAWCMQACPVDAIVINAKTGSKDIIEDRCVGCKVCTIACPFGTVNYTRIRAKSLSAIFVVVIQRVPAPARRLRSRTLMPIQQDLIVCVHGLLRLTTQRRHQLKRIQKGNDTWHGLTRYYGSTSVKGPAPASR